MDKYLSVICKKSFTFYCGKIIETFEDSIEFFPLFNEGEVYQCVLESNKYGSFLWIRNESSSKKYGPGARFTYEIYDEVKESALDYPLYTDYFYSLIQSSRILKLEKLNI